MLGLAVFHCRKLYLGILKNDMRAVLPPEIAAGSRVQPLRLSDMKTKASVSVRHGGDIAPQYANVIQGQHHGSPANSD